MASAAETYEKLRDQCNEHFRTTGKRDPKMWNDKAQAQVAAQKERRAIAAKDKPALQEAYIRSFPSSQQAEVAMRLREPKKYQALMRERAKK